MIQMETRNLRKTRQGVVISNKMDKTIVIAAKFKEKHPIMVSSSRRRRSTMPTMKRMSAMWVTQCSSWRPVLSLRLRDGD